MELKWFAKVQVQTSAKWFGLFSRRLLNVAISFSLGCSANVRNPHRVAWRLNTISFSCRLGHVQIDDVTRIESKHHFKLFAFAVCAGKSKHIDRLCGWKIVFWMNPTQIYFFPLFKTLFSRMRSLNIYPELALLHAEYRFIRKRSMAMDSSGWYCVRDYSVFAQSLGKQSVTR